MSKKKLFVPYNIAVKLKEKGFSEEFFKCYDLETKSLFNQDISFPFFYCIKQVEKNKFIPAPIYQQATDWLEEKHNLLVHRVMGFGPSHICFKLQDAKECKNIDTFQGDKALDEAILAALELI